jgi:hypothetical protein
VACSNIPKHFFSRPAPRCSFADPVHSLFNFRIPSRVHTFVGRTFETHQKFASEFRALLIGKGQCLLCQTFNSYSHVESFASRTSLAKQSSGRSQFQVSFRRVAAATDAHHGG